MKMEEGHEKMEKKKGATGFQSSVEDQVEGQVMEQMVDLWKRR